MIKRTDDTATVSTPNENHLTDFPDGCGCAEVWEYLSERRTERLDDE